MTMDIENHIRHADPMNAGDSKQFSSASADERIWQSIQAGRSNAKPLVHHQPSRRVVIGLVVATLAAAVGTTAGLEFSTTQTPAAATELNAIATTIANKPVALASADEWLYRSFTASFVSQPSSTSAVTATFSASIKLWADSTGSCEDGTFGPVAFATPADQSAWTDAGLSTAPTPTQPFGWCTKNDPGPFGQTHPGSELAGGATVIDVSSLSTDPVTLARELTTGTTGIEGLDQSSAFGSTANPGFSRAVLLLAAPLVNNTPTFQAALFGALADLGGIQAGGQTTTHTGATGEEFYFGSGSTRSSIVVNPTSGTLLEMTNIRSLGGIWLNLVAHAYSSTDPGYNFLSPAITAVLAPTIAWMDPVAPTAAVATSSVPALPMQFHN